MKLSKFATKRWAFIAAGILLTVAFFIFGKGTGVEHDGPGVALANVAAITLTEDEKKDFNEGEQKMLLAVKKMIAGVDEKIKSGKLTAEEVTAFKNGVIETLKNEEIKALKDEIGKLNEAAKKQGTSLADMELKLTHGGSIQKTIAQTLFEHKDDLQKVYENGSGTKTFMVQMNSKGELVMRPFDMNAKAANIHATVDGVGGGTASVSQSLDAATILRLGGNAQLFNQYRNTAWVFDLCNVINAGWDMPFALWYEEKVKEGASATVAEGSTKPKVQYSYELKSAQYRKEACLIGFTDEFALDFSRLQDDIMNKGRIDLINRINTVILGNVKTAATAYNTSASFNGGVPLTAPQINDYVVLAAMAAQVDNATFGALANTATMSTFKKYRLGTLVDADGRWIDRPSVLNNIGFIGNPDVAADDVMVGDFKAYNVLLRGGFIVKVGYNGTDFAENKFSVVMEQYYYDYISDIRKKAIVKGPDFETVRGLLAA